MSLNNIFTKRNIEILKLINNNEMHIREIANNLNISPATVHKFVTLLDQYDLIKQTQVKNRILITLNKKNSKTGLIMDVINNKEENKYVKKYRHLLKRKWYIQSFNATPVLIHHGGMSIEPMQKELGYSYRGFIKDFKDDFCEMYYDRDDLHRIAHELEDRQNVNPNYVQDLEKKWKKKMDEMVGFIKTIEKKLSKYSDKKLVTKYKELANYYYQSTGIPHIIEGYSLTRDVRLKALLRAELEKNKKINKFNKYFSIVTNPVKKSFINEYNNAISKIHHELKKQNLLTDFKKKSVEELERELKKTSIWKSIENLEKEFYWVRASYKSALKLKKIDFIKEIKEMIEQGEKFDKTPSVEFRNNLERKKKIIKDFKFCDALKNMIWMTDFLTNWQDERKKFMLIGCFGHELFMEEMSKRFNIKRQHLRYLLPEEVTVEKLKTLPTSFFEERVNGCFVVYEGTTYSVLSGEDFKQFKKALTKHEDGDEIKDLHGMCASVGKVTGKIRICKTIKDLNSFQKGEILVTGMTRPEFVPAMSKAIAIVTDEGGITSHAAVISRELGIPCIIGTKNATKVLNNGDLVEVNANHGLVNIIK